MPAEREAVRFYVDESALGLGKTLCAARKDTIHVGHPLIPECPTGTLDVDWIPAVARRDLVVIIRDKRIRTRPQEIERFREDGLRVFWLGGKKDLATWGYVTLMVKRWSQMAGDRSRRVRAVGVRPECRRDGEADVTSVARQLNAPECRC